MKAPKKFSLTDRAKSFPHAVRGLWTLFATQHNARVQAAAGFLVLFLGWKLEVGKVKFCLLVLCIGLVWTAEAFNTVFEVIINMLSPQYSAKARRAKDIAAGAVLAAALAAAAVGIWVLGPGLVQYGAWIIRNSKP